MSWRSVYLHSDCISAAVTTTSHVDERAPPEKRGELLFRLLHRIMNKIVLINIYINIIVLMSWTGNLHFVYFVVLFVILSMGDVLWCAL